MANDDNNNLKNAQSEAKKAARAYRDAAEEAQRMGDQSTETAAKIQRLRDVLDDKADALEEVTRRLNAAKQAQQQFEQEISESNQRIKEFAGSVEDLIPGLGKMAELLEKNKDGTRDYSKAAKSFLTGMKNMAVTMEKSNATLARQTGYATALRQDVIDLTSSHDDLYLSMEQGQEVVGALSTGFKMYNAQSKQTRGEINHLAGRFKTLGVDTNAFASVLDQLNEGFGLTGAGALAAAAELENLAIRTGSPLATVVNDFQDLGPQMSRFGSDGVRVFTELNEQARTLGMTTRQAFDFSELFDTFESSADAAGKLNAQLGLQLNSLEIMATLPADRLKILRAEFDMAGQTFDQMGRRQRQMVAEILQTDVLSAERLLGDPMALREFQKDEENRNERMEHFNTAMEKFTSVGQKLFINLSPLLTGFMSVLNYIAEFFNKVITGPFGEVISKLALFGSLVATLAKSLKPIYTMLTAMGMRLGSLFGFVSKALGMIISPILMLKDVIQSIPGVGDSDSRSAAQARLKAGAAGAAIGGGAGALGMGVGAIPGALFGYSIGREAPGVAAGFANDKMETIKGSAVLKRSDGSMTRFAAGDTFTARKDGGDLSQLVKGINQMVDLMKKSNDTNQEVVLNLDGETLARSILPDPVRRKG